MKKSIIIATAAATIAITGTAMAATANLDVKATVSKSCSVTGGTMDFGSLDPTAATNVTKTQSISVTCTKNAGYTLSIGAGNYASGTQARLYNSASTDYIPYSVTPSATSGTGSGIAQAITLTGTIASTAYTTASAGDYSDTMVITVTP